MRVLIVSEEAPHERKGLRIVLYTVLTRKHRQPYEIVQVRYNGVPPANAKNVFDVVVLDVADDVETPDVMRQLTSWSPRPLILGFYAGNEQQEGITQLIVGLGAAACLAVPSHRANAPMSLLAFFGDYLPNAQQVQAA